MSLAALASKLYTIKSRKNIPLSSAFAAMVKEDLAMRFSVYNLVKIITRSEFIASVAQAKYGKRTPLEREEDAQEKKRRMADFKFKQFTATSIANLNNKINTLTAITERNTALIANLYGEIGAFKSQRIGSINAIKDLTAVRLPLRSRTLKGQIDSIRKELDGLKKDTKPGGKLLEKALQKKKKTKEKEAESNIGELLKMITGGVGLGLLTGGAGLTTLSLGAIKRQWQRRMGMTDIEGDTAISQSIDPFLEKLGYGGAAAATLGGVLTYKTIKKRVTKTADFASKIKGGVKPTPTAPTAPTKPTIPKGASLKTGYKFDPRLGGTGRYVNTVTGKIVPASQALTATKPAAIPKAFKLPGFMSRLSIGGASKILGTGPQTIALLMGGAFDMLAGTTAQEILEKNQKIAKRFGIKFIKAKDGTPIYEINGIQYTSQNLPPEYQTILDAYIGDTRSESSRAARERISAAPGLYNSLVVEGGPLITTSTASEIIEAAKAAKLSISAPNIPLTTEVSPIAPPTPMTTAVTPSAPATKPNKVDLGTLPSVSYTPGQPVGVETVKQIIVHAANMIGVDPAIMLAMGKQESSFDPNARPYFKNKKTGEVKLLSSAKGLFQFLDSTWQDMMKKYAKDYPELNKGALDPMANAIAGALYVKENSTILRKKKIPVTGTSIYATHFLGPGGASRLLSAPPTADAVAVLPQAAKSNPHVFMNPDGSSKSVQQVIDFLYRKVGVMAETYAAQLRTNPIPQLDIATPGLDVSRPPTLPPVADTGTQKPNAAQVDMMAESKANMIATSRLSQSTIAMGQKIDQLQKQQSSGQPTFFVQNQDPTFSSFRG